MSDDIPEWVRILKELIKKTKTQSSQAVEYRSSLKK